MIFPLNVQDMPCEAVSVIPTWGCEVCLARQRVKYPLGIQGVPCEAVSELPLDVWCMPDGAV